MEKVSKKPGEKMHSDVKTIHVEEKALVAFLNPINELFLF